jgi:hypothetical protein
LSDSAGETHILTASVVTVYADHTYMMSQNADSVKYKLCYVQYLIPVSWKLIPRFTFRASIYIYQFPGGIKGKGKVHPTTRHEGPEVE